MPLYFLYFIALYETRNMVQAMKECYYHSIVQHTNHNVTLRFQEDSTEYDGFDAGSETIKHFWTVVHGMDVDDQKKLLQFVSGEYLVHSLTLSTWYTV